MDCDTVKNYLIESILSREVKIRICIKRGLIIRKIIHAIFSSLLLIPLLVHSISRVVPTDVCYVIITIIASIIYVAYFKRSIIHEAIRGQLDILMKSLSKIFPQTHSQSLQNILAQIQASFQKFEIKMREIIEIAQRDYEKRYSFVGILMGSIGVLCSYILFHRYALYGILGLAVYDTISAISGSVYGRHRLPFSTVTIEGCLTGVLVYLIVLSCLSIPILKALLITLTAVLSEAYGVEDNLSIPIFTSLASYILLRG